MKLYERKLETIYSCDYRVLEEQACGCQGHRIRCLLAKGYRESDPCDVTQSDCLECLCRKEVKNGRTLAKSASAPTGDHGDEKGDSVASGENRSNGATGSESLVPVNSGELEREILRMEREVNRIWFEIKVMANWRHPKHEQEKKSLSDTLKGGGIPTGGGPTPPSFPCSNGMPNTIYWNSPIDMSDGSGGGSPPIALNFDAGSNTYSGGANVYLPSGSCGCPGNLYGFPNHDVPVTVEYSPSAVNVCFHADSSGCPSNVADDPGGTMHCFSMPPPPFTGDYTCDPGNLPNFFSDGSGPTFTPGDGSPPCKMGWPSGGEGSFFGAGNTIGPCYIPRTIFVKIYKTSDNSFVDAVTLHYAGTWGGSPSLGLLDGRDYWTGTSSVTYTDTSGGTQCPTETADATYLLFPSTTGTATMYVHWPFADHVCPDTVTRKCFGFGSDSTDPADWQIWGASYQCFSFRMNPGGGPSGFHITTCGTASPFDCTTNALYGKGNS